MRFFLAQLFLLFIIAVSNANWPEELYLPDEEVVEDVRAEFTQDLGINTYESDNNYYIIQKDSIKEITQKIGYLRKNDNALSINKNYFDLSGSWMRKKFPFKFSSLGFEWLPMGFLNIEKGLGNGIASLRVGPVIGVDYYDMPIRIKGGPVVEFWQNSLSLDASNDVKNDVGFYGGLEIGDYKKPFITGIPFYTEGVIFGTYTQNSKITNGRFNALLHQDIDDFALFSVYFADTLSKGRTAFFKEHAGGISEYSSTYDRLNNDMSIITAIADIGNVFIKPSILYRFDQSSMNYPFANSLLDENRWSSHSVKLFLNNDEGELFSINGWFGYTFDTEDWLYKNDHLDNSKAMPTSIKDSLLIDSLSVNESDYNGYRFEYNSELAFNVSELTIISYVATLDRYKKIYPNIYVDTTIAEAIDTITIIDDRDEAYYNHRIGLLHTFKSGVLWESYFDYTKAINVFLYKKKSGLNTNNRRYKIESTISNSEEGDFIFKNLLGVLSEYDEFPDYVKKYLLDYGIDRKENFSRKVYNKFEWSTILNEYLALEGYWYEIFRDVGYWKSKYIIERKIVESDFEFAMIVRPDPRFKYTGGVFFQNIYKRNYSLKNNNYRSPTAGIQLIDFRPFIGVVAKINERVFVKADIKCYAEFDIDSDKNKNEQLLKNINIRHWVATTSVEVGF